MLLSAISRQDTGTGTQGFVWEVWKTYLSHKLSESFQEKEQQVSWMKNFLVYWF